MINYTDYYLQNVKMGDLEYTLTTLNNTINNTISDYSPVFSRIPDEKYELLAGAEIKV